MTTKKNQKELMCLGEFCAPRDMVDSLGWIGMIAILAAYAAMSLESVSSSSPIYQGLNLFGALGLVISSLPHKAYPVTALNLIWAAVALVALLKMVVG